MENKIIKSGALLVISDYNWLPSKIEDSWVSRYTDNYLIFDRYHRFDEEERIIRQKNVGQNVYDTFDFIYRFYDQLPEIAIFCRAAFLNPKDDGIKKFNESGEKISNGNCSEEKFSLISNNTHFTEIHDYGKECHNNFSSRLDSDGFGYLEINNSWYLSHHPSKFFSSLNDLLNHIFVDPDLPGYIRFSPGANYIIPKENMLKYNKKFYEDMREYIGWDIITGEAHLFERAMYTIFNSNYQIKEKYRR